MGNKMRAFTQGGLAMVLAPFLLTLTIFYRPFSEAGGTRVSFLLFFFFSASWLHWAADYLGMRF